MAERSGGRFKMLIMQAGPIPPSGGPLRERYLDHHGREALEVAASEYAAAIELLGDRAPSIPSLDFALIEPDEDARRAIQRDKRAQWIEFWSETNQSTLDAVEPHIKKSVNAAMDALNYLEDHELMEVAHAAIHRAAFLKRGLFGCPVLLRDDEYRTDCPINISHLRMGVSAGLVSDFECSICGELVEDCDHQMGQLYPKVASRTDEGTCTICDSVHCEHSEGEILLVRAHANALNIRAAEVSFVARPRYPLARIVEESKDMGPLHDDPRLRDAAKHGNLNCDADLGPCKGFNEMKNWDLNDMSQSGDGESEQVDEV
ncbi:hypothetical protein [Microbacterium sp. Gd 4-13]|uniref:hypothetical protein n=1 Tax=Microbacterium sp. Gd 4-13 TaxID=2173179 RepID=UPI001058000C|nr:hypothetical protein [Microbacterium sp. Gd 4-13]